MEMKKMDTTQAKPAIVGIKSKDCLLTQNVTWTKITLPFSKEWPNLLVKMDPYYISILAGILLYTLYFDSNMLQLQLQLLKMTLIQLQFGHIAITILSLKNTTTWYNNDLAVAVGL